MSPAELIAELDAALAEAGRNVTLRRTIGTPPDTVVFDIDVRASVRAVRATELIGNIAASQARVVLSPTGIDGIAWEGGANPSATVEDPSLPRRGDKVVIDGRPRQVEFVNPIVIDDMLVRIELTVIG